MPADVERWQESRWPPFLAILASAVMYLLLPGSLILGGGTLRWLVPGIEVIMLMVVFSPPVYEGENRRHFMIAMVCVATIANASSIVLLVHGITTEAQFEGTKLFGAAIAVWLTNVIVFALWYWEVDGGGPRARAALPGAPQRASTSKASSRNPTSTVAPRTTMGRLMSFPSFASNSTIAVASRASTPALPRRATSAR